MNALAKLALVGLIVTMTSCTRDSSKPSSNPSPAATAGSCTVSFELSYSNKPASNKSLAIYQMVDDRIKTSKEYKLGSGKTDQTGKTTIPFSCVAKATYVIMEEIQPDVIMSLRREDGQFLSFECGGDKRACNLGKMNAALFGH